MIKTNWGQLKAFHKTALQKVLEITISFDVKTSTELIRLFILRSVFIYLMKTVNLLAMSQNSGHLHHITLLKSEKF